MAPSAGILMDGVQWLPRQLGVELQRATNTCLDEAASLVYGFDNGSVSAYALPWHLPAAPSGPLWTVRCRGVQPPLRQLATLSSTVGGGVAPSNVLATLQTDTVVHLLDVSTGGTFIQSAQQRILGFFWSACVYAEFVIVTTRAVLCYRLGRQALHEQQTAPVTNANAGLSSESEPVLWMKYQHDSRILLLGTAYKLRVVQFTRQLGMTQPRDFSLSKIYDGLEHSADLQDAMSLVRLAANGRASIFILAADPANTCIHVLSLSVTDVAAVGVIEWPVAPGEAFRPSDVRYSICENLLITRCVTSGIHAVYDLHVKPVATGDERRSPAFAPVLAATAPPGSTAAPAPPAGAVHVPPNFALDLRSGDAFALTVDVTRLVQASLLAPLQQAWFVLNRGTQHWTFLKGAQVGALRRCLQERVPLHDVRALADTLLSQHALIVRNADVVADAARARGGTHAATSAEARCLDPGTICNDVLLWLNHEEAVDAPYLLAVLCQFHESAETHGVVMPVAFHELQLDTVLDQGHTFEAELMLRGYSTSWSSIRLLTHIEAAAESGRFPGVTPYLTTLWSKICSALVPGTRAPGAPGARASSSTTASAVRAHIRSCLRDGEVLEAARALTRLRRWTDADTANQVLQAASAKNPFVFASVYNALDVAAPGPVRV